MKTYKKPGKWERDRWENRNDRYGDDRQYRYPLATVRHGIYKNRKGNKYPWVSANGYWFGRRMSFIGSVGPSSTVHKSKSGREWITVIVRVSVDGVDCGIRPGLYEEQTKQMNFSYNGDEYTIFGNKGTVVNWNSLKNSKNRRR